MKRSGPLARTGWIRRGSRLPRQSKRRNGIDRLELDRMEDAARACVMVRDGASYAVDTEYLVLRWFGKCRCCQKEGGLQWCHIIGRGEAPNMVWIPSNAVAMLAGCHKFKWHGGVITGRTMAIQLVGEAEVERLLAHKEAVRGKKVDHAAQFQVNQAWLAEHGPWALRDLRWIWEQRAERVARRLERRPR